MELEIQLSRGEGCYPLNRFNPTTIVVSVSGQNLDFQCHGVFVFSELRWEVIVRFVDIGGIDDHHCLNCLIITLAYNFIFVGLWFTSHFSNLPYVMYKKVQTLRNCLLFFKLKWYCEPFKNCTCISQQHNKYFLDMLCFDRKRGGM